MKLEQKIEKLIDEMESIISKSEVIEAEDFAHKMDSVRSELSLLGCYGLDPVASRLYTEISLRGIEID